MSYFRNEIYTLNEGLRGTVFNSIYNLVTRFIIDAPRELYKRTPYNYDTEIRTGMGSNWFAGNTMMLRASLSSLGLFVLGVNPIICSIVLISLTIISLLSSTNKLGDSLDQALFQSNYDINSTVENKLIKLTDKRCRIGKKQLLEAYEKMNVAKGELASYYKSEVPDNDISSCITKTLAFHVVNRPDYVYMYYFNFDIDGIYNCYAIELTNKLIDSIDQYKIILHEVDISRIDPKLYTK